MPSRQRARHVPRLAAPAPASAGGSGARGGSEMSGLGRATGTSRGHPARPSPCAPRRAPLQLRRWAARRWARRRRWATRPRRRPRRPRPGARRSPSAARPHRPSHARHPATLTPGGCAADTQVAYQSPLRSLSVDLQHDEQQPYSSPIRQLQLVSPATPSRAHVTANGTDGPRHRYPGCARRQAEGGAALPPAESRRPRLSGHLRLPRSRTATTAALPPPPAPLPSRAPPPPAARRNPNRSRRDHARPPLVNSTSSSSTLRRSFGRPGWRARPPPPRHPPRPC